MTASWNNPKLTNAIQSDVPDIQTLLAAALKQDPTGTDDVPNGAKRLVSTAQGYELQVYNGTTWSSVGKLSHDVQTVDGYSAATGTTASTIPVRTSAGKLEGDITGNAATATTAVTLSSTLGVGLGGTGATTAETARSNLGVPPADHASSTTSYGIGTSTAYGHVKLTDDTTSQSGAAGGIAATPLLVDTVDSTCLHLSGAETASGVKTFSDGVVASVTGNLTGNASGSATTLATARSLTVSLSSSSSAFFDGSADVTVGTTGTLPVSKGGTGASSLSSITVGTATKAYQDGNGATISSTYYPKSGGELTGYTLYNNQNFLHISAGGWENGSHLRLTKSTSDGAGHFRLDTKSTSGAELYLTGSPDGTLTWSGSTLEVGGAAVVKATAIGSNYVRFSNGLQLCWGRVTLPTTRQISADNVRVTFPVAFSATPSVLTSCNANLGANVDVSVGWESTTGVSIGTYGDGNSGDVNWMAMGRWA